MTTHLVGREIHLAGRPTALPTAEDFALVEVEVPAAGDDEVVVKNIVMSVDPYMRNRMRDVPSYVPPYVLGEVLNGWAVGEVISSNSAKLSPGDVVSHMLGWREYAVGPARGFRTVDVTAAPPSAYLGILGLTGLSAYAGLKDVGQLREGDVVFVSGAAGAVGSSAGQFAKKLGASRVVGSAGSAEKVALLTEELGFDAAFNYHDAPVAEQLAKAAPDGIDFYFDNVGGEHLEAAIGALRLNGRIAACGSISGANLTEAVPGPSNIGLVVSKRLTIRGFIVSDHFAKFRELTEVVTPWLADGSVRAPETFVDGIENAPAAFIGLFHGDNVGKMLVRL